MVPMTKYMPAPHEWDEHGCCLHCGFDGAEHWWWAHDTYEGRSATPEQKKLPVCIDYRTHTPRLIKIKDLP